MRNSIHSQVVFNNNPEASLINIDIYLCMFRIIRLRLNLDTLKARRLRRRALFLGLLIYALCNNQTKTS